MPPKKTTTPMSDATIKELVARSVADALAKHKANRSKNGDDSYDSGSGGRRQVPTARECTYSDFLKCQPLNFKGTEGFIGLTNGSKGWSRFSTLATTVGHDVAYGMPWKTLMKMMTNKYCPYSEIEKLEIKIWNLKVKGREYVGGLPDLIQGSVMASKPKTMQEAIEIVNDLMDHKQNVARAYSARPSEKKEYVGTLPLCNKCKFHHNGPYTRTLTYYECGNQRNYTSDCPKLKNRNHGNQAGGTEARGMVYALGGGETDQDL
ncbi:hypothetical protein Tco_1454706, partial [Tanacetum coccineum]